MSRFFLLAKRSLKKPPFYLLLLLMLAVSAGFSGLLKENGGLAAVCLYLPDEDSLARSAADSLLTQDHPLFTFFEVSSEEELYRLVQTGRADCGYVFSPALEQALDEGVINGRIRVVTAPDSLLYPVSNETVYAALFREYSLHLLKNSLSCGLQQTAPEDEQALMAEAERLYRLHLSDGSVFSFSYDRTPRALFQRTPRFTPGTAARLLYLFVFLCCFTAGFSCYEDQKSGFYGVLTAKNRFLSKLFTLSLPLAAGTGCYLLCIRILFGAGSLLSACPPVLLAAPLVLSAVWLFSLLCPDKERYTSLLPLLITAGLLWTLL